MSETTPITSQALATVHYEAQSAQEALQAKAIADLLTQGPIETVEQIQQIDSIEDRETKRNNAEAMAQTLDSEAKTLRERIDASLANQSPEGRDRINNLLAAIDGGDEKQMKEYGLSFEYAWMSDIVATMLLGKPPVEIAAIAARVREHSTESDYRGDEAGMEIAGLLRKLDPATHNTRTVVLLNEFADASTGRELSQQEQDQYVLNVTEKLGQRGVIKADDVPGKDVLIIKESEQLKRVDDLVSGLQKSGRGEIVTDNEGNIYFKPNAKLVEALGLHQRSVEAEITTRGVLLKQADGKPSAQALDAAGFLNPVNKDFMHVVLLDKNREGEQDRTYTLLRALDVVRQERYHNIFFEADKLPPEIVSYGVAKLMQQHNKKFLDALDAYNAWEQFDPYDYVQRNYGEQLLPEDEQIIDVVIKTMHELGIAPHSMEKVADVGAGPNLYPAMLLAPFTSANAEIDLLEFSPSNREYQQKTVDETIEPEFSHVWDKFEALMVERGGAIYQGSQEAAKQKAKVKAGSIFELPEGEYDLVSSYFVSESIVDRQLPFREAIQSLAQSVKPNGTLVVAHMVGSEGYYAGEGTHFPAVNLSLQEIEEAYRDAGMEIVKSVGVGDDTDIKAREGYHGMAVIIARPLQGSSPD